MDFSMESSDHWLQGTSIEECGIMDTLCSSGVAMVERRVRPPQEEAVKCARCESTNTKFCYYNNYSLSQPRYFCKTCRRYWTKGGTLRNIPVGGGCRKNKKVSNNKKSNSNNNDVVLPLPQLPNHHDHDLHHHHHDMQFSSSSSHPTNMGLMLDQFHSPFDFMGGINNNGLLLGPNFQGFGGNLCSSFDDDAYNNNVISNSGTNYVMDSSSASQQRLMPPHHHNVGAINIHDEKPNINPKILALEWQDQGCSDVGKQPFVGGYIGGLGSSWAGMINGYGSSTTNSFV